MLYHSPCVVLGRSFDYAELTLLLPPHTKNTKIEDEPKLAVMYLPIPTFSKHSRNNSIFLKLRIIYSREV